MSNQLTRKKLDIYFTSRGKFGIGQGAVTAGTKLDSGQHAAAEKTSFDFTVPYKDLHFRIRSRPLMLARAQNMSVRDLLFLDVESIGLGFKADNVPFLIGLGYFTATGLQVRQIFSATPFAEAESLAFLDELWKKFRVVVTFNGKAFDMPLIKSRFARFHRRFPEHFIGHFDLYHLCKKMYRLPRYRLTDMEKYLLSSERINDIRGNQVGQLYFQYLKEKSGEILQPVFHHNRLDIIALANLTLAIDKDTRCWQVLKNLFNKKRIRQFERVAGEIRSYKLYRDEPAGQGELVRRLLLQRPDIDPNDYHKLGIFQAKNRHYGRALRAWRKSYESGRRRSLLDIIALLRRRRKKKAALTLIHRHLAVEEEGLQLQLLKILSDMESA